jgi:hypothetical protein
MIMNPKNNARAIRYRQLALAEADKAKAAVLYKIADEAERDVLCTVDSTNLCYARPPAPRAGGYPVTIVAPLAGLAEPGKPLLGAVQQLRGICSRAEPRDQKEGRGVVCAQ